MYIHTCIQCSTYRNKLQHIWHDDEIHPDPPTVFRKCVENCCSVQPCRASFLPLHLISATVSGVTNGRSAVSFTGFWLQFDSLICSLSFVISVWRLCFILVGFFIILSSFARCQSSDSSDARRLHTVAFSWFGFWPFLEVKKKPCQMFPAEAMRVGLTDLQNNSCTQLFRVIMPRASTEVKRSHHPPTVLYEPLGATSIRIPADGAGA